MKNQHCTVRYQVFSVPYGDASSHPEMYVLNDDQWEQDATCRYINEMIRDNLVSPDTVRAWTQNRIETVVEKGKNNMVSIFATKTNESEFWENILASDVNRYRIYNAVEDRMSSVIVDLGSRNFAIDTLEVVDSENVGKDTVLLNVSFSYSGEWIDDETGCSLGSGQSLNVSAGVTLKRVESEWVVSEIDDFEYELDDVI